MKKRIIVGTGAVAAELTAYIEDHNRHVTEQEAIHLTGYIDYDYNIEKYWKRYHLKAPVLGDIETYSFDSGTKVLLGIADLSFRRSMIEILKDRKVPLAGFIHHSSLVSQDAKIGNGNIIYPFCIIGPNSVLGDYNLLTSYSFLSHDSILGNNNFLSTAGIAGRVVIGNDNFFGIRSTVLPDISIGNSNIIQAGMTVDKDLSNDSTLFYRFKEKILAIPKTKID